MNAPETMLMTCCRPAAMATNFSIPSSPNPQAKSSADHFQRRLFARRRSASTPACSSRCLCAERLNQFATSWIVSLLITACHSHLPSGRTAAITSGAAQRRRGRNAIPFTNLGLATRFPEPLNCGGSYSGFYFERASLLAFAHALLAGTAFIGGPPSVPQAHGPSVLAMLTHEHDFVFRQAQTYTTLPLVFMFCMSPAFCLALDEAQLCRGGVAAIEKTKAAATTANLAKSFMTRPPGVVLT